MITVVWLVPSNNDDICNDNKLLQLSKTFIKLSLKTSPATVAPNGITVYWSLPSSVLKVSRMKKFHQAAGANNLFCNHMQ